MKKKIIYRMKSRGKLIGIIIAVAVFVGLASVYVPPAITGQSIVVKTSLSDVDHAKVYYFKNVLINESIAREIAAKFGFTEEHRTESKYFWEKDSKTFEIFKCSGYFSYHVWSRGRKYGTLPTEEEALEYAKQYILKYRGRLDDLELAGVATEYAIQTHSDRPDEKIPVDVTVVFKQTIDGYKTAGLNRVILEIGPNGTLWDYSPQGCSPYTREINYSVDTKILTMKQGLIKLREYGKRHSLFVGNDKPNFEIINISLVYYFKDDYTLQETLNPTWAFELKPVSRFPWPFHKEYDYTVTAYVDAVTGEVIYHPII